MLLSHSERFMQSSSYGSLVPHDEVNFSEFSEQNPFLQSFHLSQFASTDFKFSSSPGRKKESESSDVSLNEIIEEKDSAIEQKPSTVISRREVTNKVRSACAPCVQSKTRCDGQQPCSRCTRRGTEDECFYQLKLKRRKPAVPTANRLKKKKELKKSLPTDAVNTTMTCITPDHVYCKRSFMLLDESSPFMIMDFVTGNYSTFLAFVSTSHINMPFAECGRYIRRLLDIAMSVCYDEVKFDLITRRKAGLMHFLPMLSDKAIEKTRAPVMSNHWEQREDVLNLASTKVNFMKVTEEERKIVTFYLNQFEFSTFSNLHLTARPATLLVYTKAFADSIIMSVNLNPEAESLWGYSAAEVEFYCQSYNEKAYRTLQKILPGFSTRMFLEDDWHTLQAMRFEMFLTNREISREVRIVNRWGIVIKVKMAGKLLFNKDGTLKGFISGYIPC